MTINNENIFEVEIGHERMLGGATIRILGSNISQTVSKDITFTERNRGGGRDYFKGPATGATDMLQINNNFDITGRVKTQRSDGGGDGVPAFSDDLVTDNGESVELSGDYRDPVRFPGYNYPVLLGAPNIKEGSETLRNESSDELVDSEDYSIDYAKGLIWITNTDLDLSDDYSIGFKFQNTAKNIARVLSRIPKMGGAAVLLIDENSYNGGGISNYTVHVQDLEWDLNPDEPDDVEVNLNLREAFDQI